MFGLQYNLLESRLNKQHQMIIEQAESRLELANILSESIKGLSELLKRHEKRLDKLEKK